MQSQKIYHRKNQSGFTLTEMLIAIGIFISVVVGAATVYVNINATQRKLKLSEEIYNETQFILERLVKEIRKGTLDYEEYWSKKKFLSAEYGKNFGEYAKTFIDPGTLSFDGSRDTVSVKCAEDATNTPHPDDITPPCPTGYHIDGNSIDTNIGVNPFDKPENPSFSNAVCDGDAIPAPDCSDISLHFQEELYFINALGTEKTMIKRIANGEDDDNDDSIDNGTSEDSGKERIGIMKLSGTDEFLQNGVAGTDGVIDTWRNMADFGDVNGNGANFDDFIPITAPNIEITDLKFIISPLEDPRKAFNEQSKTIQHQPQVTIIISARAKQKSVLGLRGGVPEITLQTTVTSRVFHSIKSL